MTKPVQEAPTRPDGPQETGLPVLPPLSALAEIVILFALIYGLDYVTPNVSVLDLSPHPFWIPVLLVSLQYGTVSGLVAAAVAIALSLFAGLPEQDIGENLFAYFLRVLGQPILWIGVSLLVGQLRMRQLAVKQELRHANAMLTRQRDDLSRHSLDLRARVERLEQELARRYAATPHHGVAALVEAMAAGGMAKPLERQSVLERACAALFPDAVVAAYALEDNALVECAAVGRKINSGPRSRILRDDPIYRAVVTNGRGISVLDRDGEAALSGAGLMAVPIPSGAEENGNVPLRSGDGSKRAAVFGALLVEKADPSAITNEGLKALEQLGHALQPRAARTIEQPAGAFDLPRRKRVAATPAVAAPARAAASQSIVSAGSGRRMSLKEMLQSVKIQPPAGASHPQPDDDVRDSAASVQERAGARSDAGNEP